MFKYNKVNILKAITLLLVVCWMGFVFYFSNQQSNTSTKQSSSTIETILNIFPDFRNMDELQKIKMINNIQPFVRKFAHFSLYTLGGILITTNMFLYKDKIKQYKLYSFIIGFIYAITDEIHQKFIPGRSSEIRDVLIDSSGIFFGIIIFYIIFKILTKEKRRFLNERN